MRATFLCQGDVSGDTFWRCVRGLSVVYLVSRTVPHWAKSTAGAHFRHIHNSWQFHLLIVPPAQVFIGEIGRKIIHGAPYCLELWKKTSWFDWKSPFSRWLWNLLSSSMSFLPKITGCRIYGGVALRILRAALLFYGQGWMGRHYLNILKRNSCYAS